MILLSLNLAFALRHFPEMMGQTPRKDINKPITTRKKVRCEWWNELAMLASAYNSTDIRNLYPNVEDTVVQRFIRNARSSQFYEIDEAKIRDMTKQVRSVLSSSRRRSVHAPSPSMTSHYEVNGSNVSHRCERSHEQAFRDDAPYLFLRYLYQPSRNEDPK